MIVIDQVIHWENFKTLDGKTRKKSHVLSQETVMTDKDEEDFRRIRKELLASPTFRKTGRSNETKTL